MNIALVLANLTAKKEVVLILWKTVSSEDAQKVRELSVYVTTHNYGRLDLQHHRLTSEYFRGSATKVRKFDSGYLKRKFSNCIIINRYE